MKKRRVFLWILATLGSLCVILRFYVDPGIFDHKHKYMRVYHYTVEEVKPKSAKIKTLNLEFVHGRDEKQPDGDEWQVKERSDRSYNFGGETLLHVTFEDGSKSTIQLESAYPIGPSFSRRFSWDDDLK